MKFPYLPTKRAENKVKKTLVPTSYYLLYFYLQFRIFEIECLKIIESFILREFIIIFESLSVLSNEWK